MSSQAEAIAGASERPSDAEIQDMLAKAVRLYAEGRLRIEGNRVVVAGGKPPEIAALKPSP